MTVYIIGANSFLGSSLKTYFESFYKNVKQLSFRPQLADQFYSCLSTSVEIHRPKAVVIAGACQAGGDDPETLSDLVLSNVLMPATLATILSKSSPETVLVNIGTSWEVNETGSIAPFNAYAASKIGARPFFEHFALKGLRTSTLRLFDTYGPGDKRRKITGLLADAFATKGALDMSSGEQVIDLVHIDDVVRAVHETIEKLTRTTTGCHLCFSIRSGRVIRILDLIEIFKAASGIKNADFLRLGVYPYRDRERFLLPEEGDYLPSWQPKVSLEEGIRSLYEEKLAELRK